MAFSQLSYQRRLRGRVENASCVNMGPPPHLMACTITRKRTSGVYCAVWLDGRRLGDMLGATTTKISLPPTSSFLFAHRAFSLPTLHSSQRPKIIKFIINLISTLLSQRQNVLRYDTKRPLLGFGEHPKGCERIPTQQMSSSAILSQEPASRPASRPETPGIILEGREGLGGLEFDFAISLDTALLHVQKLEIEVGKEAVFKRRSDEDVYQNAWSTPTWWDWTGTANDSYVSTASTTTPALSESDQELDFSPPRAWTLIRNKLHSVDTPPSVESATPGSVTHFDGIMSHSMNDDDHSKSFCERNQDEFTQHSPMSINEPSGWSIHCDQTSSTTSPSTPASISSPPLHQRKRKLREYEDRANFSYPIKRAKLENCTNTHDTIAPTYELTPPLTPLSRDPQYTADATTSHKNLAQTIRRQSSRHVTSSQKTSYVARHSRRLRSLPP